MLRMATIVHITADFPDAYGPRKTPAVSRLLSLVPDHRHIIYSINRVNGFGGATIVDVTSDVITIVYRAPPYGLMLEPFLRPVTRCILEDIRARRLSVDVIHAHKLTVDGVVADEIATQLGAPLICSFWGNTDQKFIEAKPLMRRAYSEICQRSRYLLPATPWSEQYLTRRLPLASGKTRLLPIACELKPPLTSAPAGPRVATMFNLDAFEGKNLARLIEAIEMLRLRGKDVTLDIFGGGSDESVDRILLLMRGKEEFVSLRGPVAHADVQKTLTDYAVFALPSLRETYGMVFIEALYAGIPILYPKGQSVDGFFDDIDIGEKCDAKSTQDIAKKLERLLDGESRLKTRIAELHGRSYFERLEVPSIQSEYRAILSDTIEQAARVA